MYFFVITPAYLLIVQQCSEEEVLKYSNSSLSKGNGCFIAEFYLKMEKKYYH